MLDVQVFSAQKIVPPCFLARKSQLHSTVEARNRTHTLSAPRAVDLVESREDDLDGQLSRDGGRALRKMRRRRAALAEVLAGVQAFASAHHLREPVGRHLTDGRALLQLEESARELEAEAQVD